jgi:hypothetical protein
MKGFTKCPNGHYYKEELSACPYCQAGGSQVGKTEIVAPNAKTELYSEMKEENKTRLMQQPAGPQEQSNRTVFGEEVLAEIGGKEVVQKEYRSSRKLVGWLVTYSLDKMGVDFRLYEGRNIIGRDMDCNITVPDKMISGKHAMILFKNDKYKIKDELSSHGTFVNDNDIEDEHVDLHDNDIIRLGETVFRFKSTF